MVRGSYSRSNYMVLKQAAKIVVNDQRGWRGAVQQASESSFQIGKIETLVDELMAEYKGGLASFANSNERSIGLLLAAEAVRA